MKGQVQPSCSTTTLVQFSIISIVSVPRIYCTSVPEARQFPVHYLSASLILNFVPRRGTSSEKGRANLIRVLSNPRPPSHFGNRRNYQGLAPCFWMACRSTATFRMSQYRNIPHRFHSIEKLRLGGRQTDKVMPCGEGSKIYELKTRAHARTHAQTRPSIRPHRQTHKNTHTVLLS